LSFGCDGPESDIETDAECETALLRSANDWPKPTGALVGEKLARVVGFGASRDCGGFELGLRMGGDRGNGVNDVKFCFPIGDVTVEGGEIGKELCR
jgi:hypothetical protein